MSAKNNAVDKTVSRFVDEAIKSKKVVVFLKSMCPHCISTQKCLGTYIPHTLKAEDYSEIPLGECHKCRHVLEYLKVLTGKHTVPRVFINGKCIGGASDTLALHKSGKLADKLKETKKEHACKEKSVQS